MMAYRRRPRAVRQGSVRRRRSHPSHPGAHRHRICLALAVRASAPDPPDGGAAQGLRSGIHHHRPAQLRGRSGQAWLRQPDGDRGQFHQEDDPDRRHLLCRRDEEVGLHHHELPAAGQARDVDALLGQCRQGWQVGDLLRPVRHRQDDAVGRCVAHADRRRRAWLERAWRLQHRRRLLCQGDQAVARGRAGNLLHHRTLRHRAGECGDGSGRRASSISTTRSYAENTRAAYPIDFIPECQRDRPRRSSQECHHADGGCLRRAAADRAADAEPGDVSLPLRLHRQGGGHGKGPGQGAAADLLHLLRRAVHAAPSVANTAICCAI